MEERGEGTIERGIGGGWLLTSERNQGEGEEYMERIERN